MSALTVWFIDVMRSLEHPAPAIVRNVRGVPVDCDLRPLPTPERTVTVRTWAEHWDATVHIH